MDLDSKQPISPRASCSLPPYPPLPDCYTGHPLPSVLVPLCPPRWQGGMVEWWKGLGDPGIRISPAPLSVCPCAQGWPCVPGCTHSVEGCFCGRHRRPTWLPVSHPLCVPLPLMARSAHTPARSQRSSLWFAPHRFSPSSLLLSESPGSLCVFFRLLCASLSHMAWGAAEPSGHLGYICKFVAPSLLLPGALSCSPVHHLCSQSPSPSLWRLVPSTPLDLTGTVAQLLISSHCTRQPAQGFL